MDEDKGPVPQMLFVNEAFLHSKALELEPYNTIPEVTQHDDEQNDCYSQCAAFGIKTESLVLDQSLSSQICEGIFDIERNDVDSNQMIFHNAAGVDPQGFISSQDDNNEIKVECKEEGIFINNLNEVMSENEIKVNSSNSFVSIDSCDIKVENDLDDYCQSRQIPYSMKSEMVSMNSDEIKVERDEEPDIPFSNTCPTTSGYQDLIPSHETSLEFIANKKEEIPDCGYCHEQRKDEVIKVEEHSGKEIVTPSTANCLMGKISMEQADLGRQTAIYLRNETMKFSRCNNESNESDFVYKDKTTNRIILCNKTDGHCNSMKILKREYSNEKCFKCNFCHETFSDKYYLLKKHAETHTAEKSYKCTICDKAFAYNCLLIKHMSIHTGEKPYKCTFCKKAFIYKCLLTRHIKIHTGEKPYKCTTCDKAFIDRSQLTSHLKIHTGEKPHKCTVCDKAFIYKYLLTSHMKTHTREKLYKCPLCDNTFNFYSSLTRHLREHTGEKPYKCTVCDKECTDRYQLTNHMRIHREEKPYKAFISQRYLTNPTTIHTGELAYKCNICDKAFIYYSFLAKHMRLHKGEKP